MKETVLSLEDLRFFAPTLPDIEDAIILTGEVQGPVSDIRSEEFLLRLGKKTEIFGSFQLDGLPNFEETYINLSLQNSTIEANDLGPYLSAEIEKEIRKFKTIRLSADFAGLPSRFTTDGLFRTGIGELNGRVNYDQKDGVNSIVSKVSIKNLDLGVLAENPELLQKISLEGNVNLKGKSKEDILIGLDAVISKLGINGYTYSNIRTDANYGLDLFEGNLSISDPNLKLKASGTINLRDTSEAINIRMQLDTANLDQMRFADVATSLSGDFEIDTRGINIDVLTGIMRFKDIAIGYDGRSLELGDFFF
ncbi:MAG TPA: translocation/assembly module TamB, partial [Algoriphagus sp.]|nr:translocation/assembly module TamB [Algoriphagus sp.]